MFCTKCGTQLSDDSKFCTKCGAPTHLAEQKDSIEEMTFNHFEPTVPPSNAPAPQAQPKSHASTTADEGIYGILGFVLAFSFPLLGLIFSIMGLNKKKYSNFATAGLILSIIMMVLIVIVVIAASNSSVHYYYYYKPF